VDPYYVISLARGLGPTLCDGSVVVSPLIAAATAGNVGTLRVLLAAGAAVNAVHGGRTAFSCAYGESQAECAEALIRAGADTAIYGTALSGDGPQQRRSAGEEVPCSLKVLSDKCLSRPLKGAE
jgi:ankyrin repeat protein